MGVVSKIADKVQPSWLRNPAPKVEELLLDTDADNVGANDIVLLFKFDRPVIVRRVEMIVKTAEGGTLTIDVGDYSDAGETAVDADGFLDGANGNAAAGTLVHNETWTQATTSTYAVSAVNYQLGAYLPGSAAAPYYIGALFNNAADKAKLFFRVYYSEVNG